MPPSARDSETAALYIIISQDTPNPKSGPPEAKAIPNMNVMLNLLAFKLHLGLSDLCEFPLRRHFIILYYIVICRICVAVLLLFLLLLL